MDPPPYAIVSSDLVVMYSFSLVGMMDDLPCTFVSILGADGTCGLRTKVGIRMLWLTYSSIIQMHFVILYDMYI
jgi:hypothetical protein